ncbi:MAG TPA: DUF455 domain-containing protein, partial [Hyphomicrobiaceae bacterium]
MNDAPIQPLPNSLAGAARAIVSAADPREKMHLANAASQAWFTRALSLGTISTRGPMPDRPGRPAKPGLLPPRAMPRRAAQG